MPHDATLPETEIRRLLAGCGRQNYPLQDVGFADGEFANAGEVHHRLHDEQTRDDDRGSAGVKSRHLLTRGKRHVGQVGELRIS